jgi:hypothetical protein
MRVHDSQILEYFLHRCGEKPMTRTLKRGRTAIEGNVGSENFLNTFGNSNILAYVGFIDLAQFSTIVQGMAPEHIASYLRPFLERVIAILSKHSALIDKMIGDEIMFALPEVEEEIHPRQILVLAQIMNELHNLAFELQPNYRYRIGVSYGRVNVFQVKGDGYSEWTIVGEPVHVAKRLHGVEEMALPDPICAAFGLAINDMSRGELTTETKQKLRVITESSRCFSCTVLSRQLKGIGEVLWGNLTPRTSDRTSSIQ